MKKLFLPLITLAILCSCEKSSEVDVIAEEGLIGVSLRLDKGFSVSSSDSSADSSWSHIFQESVDITFSSTTTSYSKTVSFNPNDVSSFPNTSLPYDTYNWSIANTGGSVAVSSALYIYGSSSSTFTVSSASTTIPLSLSTDFALVTVSETNLSGVSISQGGTDTSLTTNNGFYYGYINSAFSDYTVTFTSVENQSASDTITNPSASTHYNYTISYEGGTSVTVALSDTFQLEERGVTIGSSVNLTNGLLAWYPFNGNANDESGNEKNGTLVGPTLDLDRFQNTNSSYSFNGGVNDMIELPEISSEIGSPNSSFTISVWTNANLSNSNYDGVIVCSLAQTTTPNFIVGRIGYVFNGTEVKVYHRNTNENNEPNTNSGSISGDFNDNWFHVVYIVDGANNQASMHINGDLISEMNFNYNSSLDYYNPNRTWALGNTRPLNPSQPHNFIGRIDDVGFWNRALTDAEIQALYNETDSDLTN